MREIKFRARDRLSGIWEYYTLEKLYRMDRTFHPFLQNWCEYTGLKDKNGTEISQGDIVLIGHNTKRVVEWDEEDCSFCLREGKADLFSIHKRYAATLKVIGNIYENSELINE